MAQGVLFDQSFFFFFFFVRKDASFSLLCPFSIPEGKTQRPPAAGTPPPFFFSPLAQLGGAELPLGWITLE